MSEHAPPPWRHRRERRQRSRDFTWWDEREHAETVQCPPRPRGCGRPISQTCTNRWGDELVNQPAHLVRIRLAAAAEPATEHTDTEESR